MILLGCLLALGIAVAPRAILILAWIFSDRWTVVWQGAWLAPLLGIVFLPFTTVMYMLTWKPTGIQGWDWLWILLGLFLDITNYAQGAANRKQVPGYATASAAMTGGGSSADDTSAHAPAAPRPVTTPAPASADAPDTKPTPAPASAPEPAAAPEPAPMTGSDAAPPDNHSSEADSSSA